MALADCLTLFRAAPVEGSTPKSARLNKLMKKLDELGIEGHEAKGGQYNRLLCPMVSW